MRRSDGYKLRDAGPDDLPAIAALRESVGWAAHEWALRLVLRRPARCLVAVAEGGAIAAVGSGISYGRLGFVGNMVVDAAHRRRGLGTAILAAVVAHLREAGATRLELYATPDGRPLYARHGFEPDGQSAMVRIPRIGAGATAGAEVAPATTGDLADLATYDAPRFGGDREPLLAMMLADAERPVLLARTGAEIAGYLWFRRDGARLGPFLADDPSVAAALVASAFELDRDAESLTLNLAMANEPGAAWLRSLGVALDPWDGRMGLGPRIPRRDETIYGNVVGALG